MELSNKPPALVLALAALALAAPAALAADKPPKLAPSLRPPEPRLAKTEVTRIFLRYGKVASWLDRYPKTGRTTETTYKNGSWTVKVWWGKAGEIATGHVDDHSGEAISRRRSERCLLRARACDEPWGDGRSI